MFLESSLIYWNISFAERLLNRWEIVKQYLSLVKNKPSQVDHFSGKKVEGPFVLKRQLLKLVNAIVDLVVVGYWSRFYYMKTTKVLRILFVSLLDIFVSILSAQLDKWGLLLFPSKAFSFSFRPLRRAFCNTAAIYLRQYITNPHGKYPQSQSPKGAIHVTFNIST